MRRRTILASIGGISAGLAAGCIADNPASDDGGPAGSDGTDRGTTEEPDGTDDSGESRTDTATDESTGTENGASDEDRPAEDDVQPEVVDHTIDTVGQECLSGDQGDCVTVAFEPDGVTIDGVATAPNPCHEATIESTSIENGELRVRLALESDDEICIECVGAIEYTAQIDLEGADGLDTVTVEHGDTGDAHSVTRSGDGATGGADDDPHPSETPTDDPPSDEESFHDPDPDVPILVANRHDESHDLAVTIARESGAVVYDETVEVAPGDERELYNLDAADPDGIERFDVRTAAGDQTDSVRVKTSSCYGRVEIAVTEDGDLFVTYDVC